MLAQVLSCKNGNLETHFMKRVLPTESTMLMRKTIVHQDV